MITTACKWIWNTDKTTFKTKTEVLGKKLVSVFPVTTTNVVRTKWSGIETDSVVKSRILNFVEVIQKILLRCYFNQQFEVCCLYGFFVCHILSYSFGSIFYHCIYRVSRGNTPDFGRMFLKLKYTDITKNTYVQSWAVTEIMAREVWMYDSCYTLTDYEIYIETGRNMWFL